MRQNTFDMISITVSLIMVFGIILGLTALLLGTLSPVIYTVCLSTIIFSSLVLFICNVADDHTRK